MMSRSLMLPLLHWLGCTNHAKTKGKYCKFPYETLGIASTQRLQQYQYDFPLSLLLHYMDI